MKGKLVLIKKLFHEKISLGNEVDNKIITGLDDVFYHINSLEVESLRNASASLSYELHQVGTKCIPYLMMLLFKKLEAVSCIPTYKMSEFDSGEITKPESDFFMRYLESCFESSSNNIRILDFSLPPLSKNEEFVIYGAVRSLLDIYIAEPINIKELNADIPPRMICLAISRNLSRKFNCQHEFYVQFGSILHRMNRDGLFQEARDLAEEALICSFYSDEIYFGHFVRFSLYTAQMNVVDSLLNCCLLLTSFCQESKLPRELVDRVYIEIFIALRTFNFFDFAKKIYKKYIVDVVSDEYEKQKCDLAYFYLSLMEGSHDAVGKAERYVGANREKIIGFGKSSLVPWFAFLCNLKINFPNEFSGSVNLKLFYRFIQGRLSRHETELLKNKILKGRPEGKEVLRDGLANLSRTRNAPDFIHEVNQLIVTAKRVIETSIQSVDIEGVLLAHQLKSDGSVCFNNSLPLIESSTIQFSYDVEVKNSSFFKQYLTYVKQSLSKITSKQFVWIGFKDDKLYCVIFESGEFTFCDYVESTNRNEFSNWIRDRLPFLAFEDTPNTGSPFISREDFWSEECASITKDLPCVDIPISSSEIVLFCDVEFSSFPHNLIKANGGIVSLNQGVCSPLSFDNYLKYEEQSVNIKSIYAWAPTVECDMAISIAFSKLREELGEAGILYDESLIPNPAGDINIFISHGGRDGAHGFRGLYPSDGKSYVTDNIFGRGKVALLFVCHSGAIVENYYSISTYTLIKTLLNNGYEAVISPSWSLNVSIPGVWTKEFISSLNSKFNITDAVFRANVSVHKKFLTPSASAAMHIFGNGNIKGI